MPSFDFRTPAQQRAANEAAQAAQAAALDAAFVRGQQATSTHTNDVAEHEITYDDLHSTVNSSYTNELAVTPTADLNKQFNTQDSAKTIWFVVIAIIAIFLGLRVLKTQHIIK